MPEQNIPEPSMDEILASIRRIVSEDDGPAGEPTSRPTKPTDAGGAAGAADPGADVLELTERAPPEPTTEAADLAGTPSHAPIRPSQAAPADGPLIGEPASATASSSFERLSAAVDSSAKARQSPVMPAPGRSLEDLTRDLLRPLIKAWLDEHLPAIVQESVDEEVARIARGRVR